jgi:hypothetical protein
MVTDFFLVKEKNSNGKPVEYLFKSVSEGFYCRVKIDEEGLPYLDEDSFCKDKSVLDEEWSIFTEKKRDIEKRIYKQLDLDSFFSENYKTETEID